MEGFGVLFKLETVETIIRGFVGVNLVSFCTTFLSLVKMVVMSRHYWIKH
jgi:hypothetical protein